MYIQSESLPLLEHTLAKLSMLKLPMLAELSMLELAMVLEFPVGHVTISIVAMAMGNMVSPICRSGGSSTTSKQCSHTAMPMRPGVMWSR